MKTVLKVVLIVFGGLLLLLTVAFCFLGLPWLVGPPDAAAQVAQRWTQVESWAVASPESGASPARLLLALQNLKGPALAQSRRITRQFGERVEPDDDARRALSELSAWASEQGGLGPEVCQQRPGSGELKLPPFKLLALGRLAAACAQSGDDPALLAALRLAAQMRQRDGALFAAIGFAIADEIAKTARARGFAASEPFARYKPLASEVFPSLAREAVCTARMVQQAMAAPPASRRDQLASPPTQRLMWMFRPDRELQMLKWYEGRKLEHGYPVREDLAALAGVVAMPDGAAMPKSLILRATQTDFRPRVLKARDQIQRYEAFLHGAPAPAEAQPTEAQGAEAQ